MKIGKSVEERIEAIRRESGHLSLALLRASAETCQACPLYQRATQTVFGEGPQKAVVVFVGEQPGDREDREGQPFVGPSGKLFDQALAEVGIDRSKVYVTNSVKHFKWEPVRKLRLHQRANAAEITACRPWLLAELAVIKPLLVVALGATAAQTLAGKTFRVTRERGTIRRDVPGTPAFLATVHPSSILRGPPAEREQAYRDFVSDLQKAAAALS